MELFEWKETTVTSLPHQASVLSQFTDSPRHIWNIQIYHWLHAEYRLASSWAKLQLLITMGVGRGQVRVHLTPPPPPPPPYHKTLIIFIWYISLLMIFSENEPISLNSSTFSLDPMWKPYFLLNSIIFLYHYLRSFYDVLLLSQWIVSSRCGRMCV